MRRLLLLLAVFALAACSNSSGTADAGGGDGGAPIDNCNSPSDALNNAECQLALGDGGVQGYIWPAGDHDWWHIHIDDVPARALLTVTGQIHAPQSNVTLQVLVFQGLDGGASLGSNSIELNAAPQPTTVVARISQPGDYFVLVQDDTFDNDDPAHGDADARHPYSLTATLASDVDSNEPNDTPAQATPIPLSGNQGQATGALATQGDVDVYAVDIPASAAPPNRWVLYVGIDAPALTPNSQTELGYAISLDNGQGADGGVIFAGHSPSLAGEQQASTALLVPQAGRYYVTVDPYLANPTTDPQPPGDPRLVYTVNVKLVQDLDTNEPNDLPTQATTVSIASPSASGSGPSTTVSGRLGYVPDPDWYNVVLRGSQGQNTRLRYQLTVDDSAANSKRFPPAGAVYPWGDIIDHQITVSIPMADTSTCQAQCPNVGASAPLVAAAANAGCGRPSHECDYSYRLEGPYPDGGGGISNFQGEIPVPAHSGDVSYHVLVEDQGNNEADDRVYNLQLWWLDEPTADDQGPGYQDQSNPATISTSLGSYSEDPGSANAAKGSFSFGHGVQADNQADNGVTEIPIKNELDYDAINDTDYFKIQLPAVSPTGTTADGGSIYPALAWSSAWTLPPAAGMSAGSRPYDLQMTYFFCDGDKYPGGCDPQTGKWEAIGVGYQSGTIAGWTNAGTDGWKVDTNSGRFVTNASECFCIEPRFVKSGVMYMAVSGISRASYEDAPYEVDTAFAPYPQSFTDANGATKSCPSNFPDGGGRTCHFCNQQFGDGCQEVDGITVPRQLP